MLPKWRYCHSFITNCLTRFQDNYTIATLPVNCILGQNKGLSQLRNNRGWSDGLLQTLSSACCDKLGKSNRISCQDNSRTSRYKIRITPEQHRLNHPFRNGFLILKRLSWYPTPTATTHWYIKQNLTSKLTILRVLRHVTHKHHVSGTLRMSTSVLLGYCAPSLEDHVRRFGTALW